MSINSIINDSYYYSHFQEDYYKIIKYRKDLNCFGKMIARVVGRKYFCLYIFSSQKIEIICSKYQKGITKRRSENVNIKILPLCRCLFF